MFNVNYAASDILVAAINEAYAGFQWLTSDKNQRRVARAIAELRSAIATLIAFIAAIIHATQAAVETVEEIAQPIIEQTRRSCRQFYRQATETTADIIYLAVISVEFVSSLRYWLRSLDHEIPFYLEAPLKSYTQPQL